MIYKTHIDKLTIREANIEDADLILNYIKKLAEYEHLSHQVVATKSSIIDSIFIKRRAHVLILLEDQVPIGFSLYFFNYSTFLGKANLYIEDIYIEEAYRHKGYGKELFHIYAKIALDSDCQRIDWMCLDWNQSALDFYKNLGAIRLDDWKLIRLNHEAIKNLNK